MARTFDSNINALFADKRLAVRDMFSILVKDRTTPATTQRFNLWSATYSRSINLIDPYTDNVISRTYQGAGANVAISDIPLTSGLVVNPIQIRFSHIANTVETFLRTWSADLAPVEIHRLYMDPNSLQPVAAAVPRFIGTVDENQDTTPPAGGEGSFTLTCVPHTQEMLRINSATRSDEDQRLRDPDDNFYRHAAVVGTWEIWWGEKPS